MFRGSPYRTMVQLACR